MGCSLLSQSADPNGNKTLNSERTLPTRFDTAAHSALVEDCRIRMTLVQHPTSQSILHSSLFRERKEETADISVEFLRGQSTKMSVI
jgi:hypothetical protein